MEPDVIGEHEYYVTNYMRLIKFVGVPAFFMLK